MVDVSQGCADSNKNFHNWIAHVDKKSKKKICYTYSAPEKTQFYSKKRNTHYLAINYIVDQGFTISVDSGYKMNEKLPTEIILGSNKETMQKSKDRYYATTYSERQDVSLTDKIISSSSDYIYVRSYDESGNIAIDHYPIKGLLESMLYIQRICS